MKYHYNPKTGRASQCHALSKDCPLGAGTLHGEFGNSEVAVEWARVLREKQLNEEFKESKPLTKKIINANLNRPTKISKETYSDDLNERLYFYSKDKISGTINYNELNEDSYKDFDFMGVTQDEIDVRNKFEPWNTFREDVERISADSRHTLSNLTFDEKISLKFYGGSGYLPINQFLYRDPRFNKVYNQKNSNLSKDTFYDNVDCGLPLSNGEVSKAHVKALIKDLDTAITQAPKRQKIVYRGIAYDTLVKETTTDNSLPLSQSTVIKNWVKENRAIGTEIVMEGFTSTTANFLKAKNFTETGGVVYEILTAEGANISGFTELPAEREILLPRQQRYMVVGLHMDVDFSIDRTYQQNYHIVQLVAINSKGEILDGTNSDPIREFNEEES